MYRCISKTASAAVMMMTLAGGMATTASAQDAAAEASSVQASAQAVEAAELGPRPFYLVDRMAEGELKQTLAACAAGPFTPSRFSIGHRGAPLQFPEHTRESYLAAARMGAGILECDVTFTKDRQLVCRHSQCDLHTSTDILARPELAAKCTTPFTPADPATGRKAEAKCCTSDLTLAEFQSLRGKMDGANVNATTVADYMKGTAGWRTDLYASTGTLMTHAESIALFSDLGVQFTPELKAPSVPMPFDGDYTQDAYAQQLIDEYKAAGIDPADVFAQSFQLRDVLYWLKAEPAFGAQGVFLDDRDETLEGFDAMKPESWKPGMQELVDQGVEIIAPPLHVLVTLDGAGKIVPSAYAKAAKAAGLDIITWTLERSGTLADGGGYYFQSVKDAIKGSGDTYVVLDVLAKDVGVRGVFTDWAATVTYYANCMDLD
jgi:glycerophosphoryl diester phosphodiesterase